MSGTESKRDVPGKRQRQLLLAVPVREMLLSAKFQRVVRIVDHTDDTSGLVANYAEQSADMGIGGFVLGLHGAEHVAERTRLSTVIKRAHPRHLRGLEAIRTSVSAAIGRPTGEPIVIDLKAVVRTALNAYTVRLTGMQQGEDEEAIADAATQIVARTYENPGLPGCPLDVAQADDARAAAGRLRALVENRLVEEPAAGTLLHSLREERLANPYVLDQGWITRNMLGLVGGPSEVLFQTALSVSDWALADAKNWEFVRSVVTSSSPASSADGELRLLHEMHGIVSLVPAAAMLPRVNAKGRPMFLSLWDHRKSRKHRLPPDVNKVFGLEPHSCLGQNHALQALSALLFPIFSFGAGTYVHNKKGWRIRLVNELGP